VKDVQDSAEANKLILYGWIVLALWLLWAGEGARDMSGAPGLRVPETSVNGGRALRY